MASIFKRSRDKNRRRSCWYISYQGANGKRITKKAFTDRRLSEAWALELELAVKREKEGLIDPNEQRRLAASETPIAEHVEAFKKSISQNTPKYIQLIIARIERLIAEGEFKTIAQIDLETVAAVLGEMLEGDDEKKGEIGRKTYNHYASSMNQFCAWLVPKRLAANPLAGMKRLNTEVDVRHPRRALSAEEFAKLVESARTSGESIQCFDGEQRARIYTLSYMTGLRRKEIASLTPSSFNLKTTPATLTVEAACSKHRRKDVLPLHPELVTMLKVWLRGMSRKEHLFPLLDKRRTWWMVKKDLERAGIPYRTDEGIADFHAAGRHTHITELLRNGVTLPEARELARHSDIRMTMEYAHIGLEDQAKAVSKLPWYQNGESENTSNEDDEDSGGQRPASGASHLNGHLLSSPDAETVSKGTSSSATKHLKNSSSDASLPLLSPPDNQAANLNITGSIPAASTFDKRCQTTNFDDNPCQ